MLTRTTVTTIRLFCIYALAMNIHAIRLPNLNLNVSHSLRQHYEIRGFRD